MNISAINFHLTKHCNYKCKFCFATFADKPLKTILSKGDMIQIINQCTEHSVSKISFVGGEPMLCNWLDELIIYAKNNGLTTMLVTNGSLLTSTWLKKVQNYLDWVSLSIDSLETETLRKIGRSRGKKTLSREKLIGLIESIQVMNIRFKINTVVNALNYTENMNDFMIKASPKRWKIFQVLPIKGQSDNTINEMKISDEQFEYFLINHKKAQNRIKNFVVENNELMTNSYVMIDPFGRFFDNTNHQLNYSEPILNVGFEEAYKQINFSLDKFNLRDGNWSWK